MTNEIKKYCEGLDCAWCNEKEPCIYKIANELEEQLSVKEQECEELKEKLKEMNEVIRTETTRCSLVYFLQTDLDQLKSENKHLNDLLNQALKEIEKARETLTEIKELLLKTPTDSPIHCVNAKSVILQKISEVIE